jgi:hypothetical protein
MKKLRFLSVSIGVLTLSFGGFISPSISQTMEGGGCVKCTSGSTECQRVITEDENAEGETVTTVHIFYGKPNPC